ncbi:hypothetical protein P691DRAFT_764759 [Macrolepiota fuliginosa MF-IS2]|uniref:Uncharacterized protein n=1 Tax=Macrolepiota fuliginosa MF-IS2 TaxID=1400762 RepID=A0A9P6BYW0_9AGAR|nr:hypothetical protein P691DRAFT_764759 [Macrolepiota fuliginosa MF-IS2]
MQSSSLSSIEAFTSTTNNLNKIGCVATCVLASRMILGLKDYGNHTSSFGHDLAYSMSVLSTIRFGVRNTRDDCEEA